MSASPQGNSGPSIACPRCGYDQSGHFRTWTESCPLRSTCTECGLAIEWHELLNPDFKPPAWSVEHTPNLWRVPRRMLTTAARTFAPWNLFRAIRMSHPIRPWRLVGIIALWIAILYTSYLVMHGVRVWNFSNRATTTQQRLAEVGWAVLLPLNSRRLPTAAWWWRTSLDMVGDDMEACGTNSDDLSAVFMNPIYPQRWTVPIHDVCIGLVICILLSPVGFIFLPTTRRAAKVRPVHILRVTSYLLPFVILLALVAMANIVSGERWTSRSYAMSGRAGFTPLLLSGLIFLSIPALTFWWSRAVRHYFRMPHPWGVAAALVALATLSVAVLFTIQAG
jgi:hypothetical protein